MDTTQYICRQFTTLYRQLDGALKDITQEQFNWTPPGMANTIRAILLHTTATEDRLIHVTLLNQPYLWETGDWSNKIGLIAPPGRVHGWDEIKSKPLSLEPVLAYVQSVHADTLAYLDTLTPEQLDREVTAMGSERPIADVLIMIVNHTTGHAGEIAALRGVQGVQGLPF